MGRTLDEGADDVGRGDGVLWGGAVVMGRATFAGRGAAGEEPGEDCWREL
jgi:hypothetical protein